MITQQRQSPARLFLMTSSAPAALVAALHPLRQCVCVYDAAGRCRFINPALERWLQRPHDEVIGAAIEELWPQPFAALEARDLTSVLDGQQCDQIESRPAPSGPRQVRTLKYRWRSDDAESLVVVLFEEVAPSNVPARNDSIDSLLSGIGHEFNESLLLLRGQINRLEQLHPNLGEELRMMDLLLDQAAALPRRLLAFTREEGQPRERIEIQTLLRSLGGLLRGAPPEQLPIDLLLSSEPCWVHADPVQLTEALLGLVGGTLEASPRQRPLRIESLRDGDYVRIIFENTASDAVLPNRLSGLGLAILYEVVRRHRGRLSCVGEPGRGMRVVLDLPLLSEGERARPRASVLLLDEDPTVSRLTTLMLEHGGYHVLASPSLDSIHAFDADFLIVCARMLTAEGIVHLEKWLALHPAAHLIVTITGMSLDLSAACRQRLRGVLRKPYRTETLLLTLSTV